MIQYEIKDDFVEITMEAIYEDVKFIFIKEYFEVLGFQDVSVDSGDIPVQEGGGGSIKSRKQYKASGTAAFMLGTIGRIVEKVKSVFRTDKEKGIPKEEIDKGTLKATVPIHVESVNKDANYIVETAKTDTNISEEQEEEEGKETENEKIEELKKKIEELEKKLQEKEEPVVQIKEDVFQPEPPAMNLDEYVDKAAKSMTDTQPADEGSLFEYDPPLKPIRIRFRFVSRFDESTGLSGIATQEQFEAAMAKQLADKNNLEVSAATKGRTIQQKHKEEQDEEEQWYMKNHILDVSKNRDLILRKYTQKKSKGNVYETFTDFTQSMIASITGSNKSEPGMPTSEKAESDESKKEDSDKSELDKTESVESDKAESDKEESDKSDKAESDKAESVESKKADSVESKKADSEQKGGDKTPFHEIFYLYARPEDKVATKLDFRLFPDEVLKSMPQ